MNINDIILQLENLSGRERTDLIDEIAREQNISRKTVWAMLNKAGFRQRKVRVTKGSTLVEEFIIERIASQVAISKRLNGNFTNSVKKAIADTEAEGISVPVSYQRICELMRERGLDKKSLSTETPHVKLLSLHPNHVWQFDVTNCLQWHLKNKGGFTERVIERLFYKNKVVEEAKKIRQQLLRFVMVDHCSGAFFFWYYYTSGEKATDGADFFFKAFSKKNTLINETLGIDYHGKYQMQGVPLMIYADKGSILTSQIMKNLLSALDIKVELHQAGNPRAKGMVEGLMKIIGNDFESNLKRYRVDSLDELNKMALDWCIKRNTEYAFRGSYLRADLWLNIKQEELRICLSLELFKILSVKPQSSRKTDGSRIISFEGRYYQIPDVNAVRCKVIVSANAYEYPAVNIHFNGKVWLCYPLIKDSYGRVITADTITFGEYKSLPDTNQQKINKHLEEVAFDTWGVEYKGHKDKRQSVAPTTNKQEFQPQEYDEKIIALEKKGTAIEIEHPFKPLTNELKSVNIKREQSLIPLQDIIRQYLEEFGKLTPDNNRKLKTLYPDGVPHTITLTEIYNELNTQRVIDFKKHA